MLFAFGKMAHHILATQTNQANLHNCLCIVALHDSQMVSSYLSHSLAAASLKEKKNINSKTCFTVSHLQ